MSHRHSTVPARHPEHADASLLRVLAEDGSLADPALDPRLDEATALAIHRTMLTTRLLDRALEKIQRQGRIAFHVSSLGEEAAVVASAAALASSDWIVPCYREIGALLHRGDTLAPYLDMMFGNADDEAHGHQMPEHASARAQRYASVSAPIGTQIPHAVGMAYALKLRRVPEVVGVYFGDGATSSTDFHAGMNFAGVWRAPVVFLCRNNRWAISLPTEEQTAAAHLADKAISYGFPGVRCDGNDVLAVYVAVRRARERALRGEGPTLVEMMTYREGGHSTSDDPSVYRTDVELEAFVAVDPLPRFRRYLERTFGWTEAREAELQRSIEASLKAAIAAAEAKPRPARATIFDDVFAEPTPELERQRREATRAEGGS